jgi:hypothetical protein
MRYKIEQIEHLFYKVNISKSKSCTNGNGILSGEIRSLQALAKCVAENGDYPSVGLADLLKIVEFHGRACTRLATLLRAERDLDDTPSMTRASWITPVTRNSTCALPATSSSPWA